MKKSMIVGMVMTSLFSFQLFATPKVRAEELNESSKVVQGEGHLNLIKKNKKQKENSDTTGQGKVKNQQVEESSKEVRTNEPDETTMEPSPATNKNSSSIEETKEPPDTATEQEKSGATKNHDEHKIAMTFDQIQKNIVILTKELEKVSGEKHSSQFGQMLASLSGKLIYGEVS
ncbi:hypothetical protein ACWOFR_14265 [Carnobacterium gallinarum]|uniref:hypothetical protein n=1 Tax=Carnobacterium gallinarum TaxID=2749 RepID=UPI00054E5455|nr:hypothetical protein [Carnobacterium gallinarum]